MDAWNSIIYICTVISLLPKATFTPSNQPNLGLPCTRSLLTSAINTLLAIRYSSILSTCPNHPNILWSTQFANSLRIPALLSTLSFLAISIRDSSTKLLNHISHEHSLSFSQHFSYPLPLLHTMPLVKLLRHIIQSVDHIPFTSSIRCHLRSQVLKTIHFLNGSPSSLTWIRPTFTYLETSQLYSNQPLSIFFFTYWTRLTHQSTHLLRASYCLICK